MASLLQHARAYLCFEQSDFNGMATALQSTKTQNAGPIPLEWLATTENLARIRDVLQTCWLQAFLNNDRAKLNAYTAWLDDQLPAAWAQIKPLLLLPVFQELYENNVGDSRTWSTSEPAWWELLACNTKLPKPNREWRMANQAHTNILEAFTHFVHQQPLHEQTLQLHALNIGGCTRLTNDPLLYYLLSSYREPTKEETYAVAIAKNPLYDVERLELHFPGFKGLTTAISGLEINKKERDAMCAEFLTGYKRSKELSSLELPTSINVEH